MPQQMLLESTHSHMMYMAEGHTTLHAHAAIEVLPIGKLS
jgi:hypothetical protein